MPIMGVTLLLFLLLAGVERLVADGVGYERMKFLPADGACGDKGPWAEMCVPDGEGNDGEGCRRCLVGPEWDSLRAALGTEVVRGRRSTVPTVITPNWSSGTLLGSAFRILLQEMLGYEQVRSVTAENSYFVTEQAALEECGAITMEAWFSAPINASLISSTPERGKALSDHLGAVGEESLFVPRYLPVSYTDHRELRADSQLMHDFPEDGSVGVNELSRYFPAGEPWGCDAVSDYWPLSTCNTSRWYPSHCDGSFPSSLCRELYLPSPAWSEGWFEAMIENNKLNFSVVYPGYTGHLELIEAKFRRKEPMMFYWWTPEPLLLRYPATQVRFPVHSPSCQDKYRLDPKLSGVDCQREATSLRKVMPGALALSDPDIHHLWEQFRLTNSELFELMTFHKEGGGPHSNMYDASCAWLKSSQKWRQWLNISDPCTSYSTPRTWDRVGGQCVEPASAEAADASSNAWWIAVTVAAVVGIPLAIGGVFLYMRKNGMLARWDSGTGPPPLQGQRVTLAITDIQGSTSLWDAHPTQLAKAIALHHSCLRATLKECNGYEVATEGDLFKCAFHNPEDAICWAIKLQLELLCVPWDTDLEDGGEAAFGDPLKWADTSNLPTEADLRIRRVDALGPDDSPVFETDVDFSAVASHTLFNVTDAANTGFSLNNVAKRPYGTVWHRDSPRALPVFRGLRVRVGIHTGVADVVGINDNTKRVTYGGMVAAVAKAVSDVPAGGQIVVSGETIAAIGSMHGLQQQVSRRCQGWASGLATRATFDKPAMSIIHMGRHTLSDKHMFESEMSARSGLSSPSAHPSLVQEEQTEQSWHVASVCNDSIDQEHLNAMSKKLQRSHELLTVVPWPLKARQWCFPPLQSDEKVTAGLYEAPGMEGVTIVFTFIEKWSKLIAWAEREPYRREILDSTKDLINLVVRTTLVPLEGYEVEGEDGCFVCAFHTPQAAIEFGVLLQSSLRAAWWHTEVLSTPWCRTEFGPDGETVMLKGPRVKVGMCTGDAVRVQPCVRTGRMEYYGPLMNHAARVASTAYGGQVLLHELTAEALDMSLLDKSVTVSNCGKHSLKGIHNAVTLYQACGPRLLKHTFPALKNKGSPGGSRISIELQGRLDTYLVRIVGDPSERFSKAQETVERLSAHLYLGVSSKRSLSSGKEAQEALQNMDIDVEKGCIASEHPPPCEAADRQEQSSITAELAAEACPLYNLPHPHD